MDTTHAHSFRVGWFCESSDTTRFSARSNERNLRRTGSPTMGRVKLKIKRLESTSNRQVTYSKRRNGIIKKARELSILCDIDIILLMFSPTGKPTLFLGERSNIDDVIAKFAQLTPSERAKRKMESLEALKKTFKKLDHDVDVQDFLGASTQSVEELSCQVRVLRAQLADVHKRFSCWTNPDRIDNIELLTQMENSLRESLNRIHVHKENFGKHEFMPLDCASEFQTGMHMPLMIGGNHENPSLSWLPNNENEHMILSNNTDFLPERDMECSRNASLPSYSGFFDIGKTEIDGAEQVGDLRQGDSALNELNNADCLRLQLNEQYHRQIDDMRRGDGSFNEFNRTACLRQQLNEQYPLPFHPYDHLNLPGAKELKPLSEVNFAGNPLDYQISSNFQLPRPSYDNVHQTWFSASGPCAISMSTESSYPQQPNQL